MPSTPSCIIWWCAVAVSFGEAAGAAPAGHRRQPGGASTACYTLPQSPNNATGQTPMTTSPARPLTARADAPPDEPTTPPSPTTRLLLTIVSPTNYNVAINYTAAVTSASPRRGWRGNSSRWSSVSCRVRRAAPAWANVSESMTGTPCHCARLPISRVQPRRSAAARAALARGLAGPETSPPVGVILMASDKF